MSTPTSHLQFPLPGYSAALDPRPTRGSPTSHINPVLSLVTAVILFLKAYAYYIKGDGRVNWGEVQAAVEDGVYSEAEFYLAHASATADQKAWASGIRNKKISYGKGWSHVMVEEVAQPEPLRRRRWWPRGRREHRHDVRD